MKTREEVEALKAQWLKDPSWDIENMDGFEEYAVELAAFAIEHQAIWRAAREKAEAEAYRNTPASEATLRDMFAAAVVPTLASGFVDRYAKTIATEAYEIADAMMAARRVPGSTDITSGPV